MNLIQIVKQKVFNNVIISFKEAELLSEYSPREEVYNLANEIRIYFNGNKFDMCSIENARSGLCNEDCKWCAQTKKYPTKVEEYEVIDHNLAVKNALYNAEKGVHRYSLVTSGRGISNNNLDKLLKVYEEVKSKSNISLCASMGIIDREKLAKLKDAGIVHYHCNVETAKSFFPEVCSTHSYDEKIQTIENAKSLGLKICSGGIFGMGETMMQRIEMAFELREIGAVSIPINILSPIEGTPLQGQQPLEDEEILTLIALFRIINPKANIRFAGGRNLIRHIQEKALKSGINASLVGDLLTTVGSNIDEDKKDFTKAGFEL